MCLKKQFQLELILTKKGFFKMIFSKSRTQKTLYVLFIILIYLFMFMPIIAIIINSCNESLFASNWKGFTLKWYKELFNSAEIGEAVLNSLIVAGSSTFLSVLLGTSFVLGTSEKKHVALDALFYPNIFTPDIVLAVAILALFKTLHIPCGFVSLIIGHTAIGLVFAIPLLRTRMDELDKHLIEASLDLGADHWYTARKILLPLLRPAIITSAFMAFTLSLDDFFISFFCSGNEIETISMYIFSHLRTNSSPVLSALSACMFIVSFTLLLVGYFATQRTQSENKA